MRKLLKCRRSILAIYAISILAFLSYTKNIDTSMAISSIIVAVAGANAYEKKSPNNSDYND